MTEQRQPTTPTRDRQYSGLRWRLWFSYLAMMTAIFGISGTTIYGLFVKNLYQQVDDRLRLLADAAAHSLVDIQQKRIDVPLIDAGRVRLPMRRIDLDGDLDVSWYNLRQTTQGIEWFDANYQRLATSGWVLTSAPLQPEIDSVQTGTLRSLTLAVYNPKNRRSQIQGYVRVSESVQSLEDQLHQLQWVFGVGGILALGLAGTGSIWLTQQSLRPIRQSFEQLKQFTADASHELRNPLTAVKLSVDVLRSDVERFSPEERQRIETIAIGIDQIRFLVEDLMLLARMDADRSNVQEQRRIALDEILEDLLELLESQAVERQIALKSDLIPDAIVKGDATQLPRLFRNLFENALKYTPIGGSVTVSMQRSDRTITVSIQDTGMGIAPQHLPKVFDRFWRADAARSSQQPGLGLGLAIAQAIACQHQGKVTVTSELGVGSCFQVQLPLA
ncbi:histidine kinase [Tumidithrix helvetica PCC 7403]|uniref:sensor histidine kinase n=1 Tax=Tumidithrix helvetica TaxID=3457545 RepID=UPI003C91285E